MYQQDISFTKVWQKNRIKREITVNIILSIKLKDDFFNGKDKITCYEFCKSIEVIGFSSAVTCIAFSFTAVRFAVIVSVNTSLFDSKGRGFLSRAFSSSHTTRDSSTFKSFVISAEKNGINAQTNDHVFDLTCFCNQKGYRINEDRRLTNTF